MHTRRTRRLGTGTVLIAVVALAACGSSGGNPATSSRPPGDRVELKLVAYRPDRLTVTPGTKVTWTQRDPGVHTVTAGTVDQGAAGVTVAPDGTYDSGNLTTGESYSHTFSEPGTYRYFCRIHPATMRGTVTVR